MEAAVGQVLRSGKPALEKVVSDESIKASLPAHYWEAYSRLAPHSYILAPLQAQGLMLGSMSLTRNRRERAAFTEDDLNFALGLAGYAALAIKNAQLFERAQKD